MSDKNKGIYEKFKVERTDGESAPGEKHHNCRYFVIDIDHDEFASSTLKRYAVACASKYPRLAKDLKEIAMELDIKKCPSVFSD